MIRDLWATLALWPGVFLILAGVGKAVEAGRRRRQRSLVSLLLPGWLPAGVALVLLASVELTIGVLVIATVLPPVPEALAAALLAAAGVAAVWGIRRAPGTDCGCLGALANATLSWWTVARAWILSLMAAGAAATGHRWFDGVATPPVFVVLLAEAVVLVWLSPELHPRRLAHRLQTAQAARCAIWYSSPGRTIRRLQRSQLWLAARPQLITEHPSEHWRQGCWRFICFPARHEGLSPVTGVFAVPLKGDIDAGTVAFVDETNRQVVGRITVPGNVPVT